MSGAFGSEGVPVLGNTRVILGLYWDNGKFNGNYYLGLGCRVGSHTIRGTILGVPRTRTVACWGLFWALNPGAL